MISGTSYSPSKAFIRFARKFFDRLALGDYGGALAKLDASATRWKKQELQAQIVRATGGSSLSSCDGIIQSAHPQIEEISKGVYDLRHRLPVNGKWVTAKAVFRFSQKPGTEYFHVELQAIEF